MNEFLSATLIELLAPLNVCRLSRCLNRRCSILIKDEAATSDVENDKTNQTSRSFFVNVRSIIAAQKAAELAKIEKQSSEEPRKSALRASIAKLWPGARQSLEVEVVEANNLFSSAEVDCAAAGCAGLAFSLKTKWLRAT